MTTAATLESKVKRGWRVRCVHDGQAHLVSIQSCYMCVDSLASGWLYPLLQRCREAIRTGDLLVHPIDCWHINGTVWVERQDVHLEELLELLAQRHYDATFRLQNGSLFVEITEPSREYQGDARPATATNNMAAAWSAMAKAMEAAP